MGRKDLSLLFSALLACNIYCLKPGTSKLIFIKCLLSFNNCNYFLLRKQISSCLSRWIPYPSASSINKINIKTSDKNCSLQKSNPAAPVSGENYLYLHGSIYYVVSKCFYYKHPLYYIDGQLLMAYIPLEAFCLLPLEMCLMSFLSPSRL